MFFPLCLYSGWLMNDQVPSKVNVISAVFLVAGTCIGGGMLALPVATGLSGFFPSSVIMALSWLMMTASALLLLEVSLWMEEGVHVITMTSRLLGRFGKGLSWILFLFISYASLIAYGSGGGLLIANGIKALFGMDLGQEIGCLFFFVFGLSFYLGNTVVGKVNAILFIAMVLSYVALVGMGVDEMKPELLLHKRWGTTLIALPVLLTSFSFQTMVPSLTPYLKRHASSLKKAIIWGTTLTFVVYLVWQSIILSIIPVEGEQGLIQLLIKGVPATEFLHEHVHGPFLAQVAQFFAFFALVTSFLGMGLGLYDFLSDGLHIKERGWGSVFLTALVIAPSYYLATHYDRVFLVALDATGGFGDAILNGIIPCLMVWVGRYRLGYKGLELLAGGKTSLALVLLFYVLTVIFVLLMQFNIVTSIFNVHETL